MTGLDFDAVVVAGLAAGKPPVFEPGLEDLVKAGLASRQLRFTTDVAAAAGGADIVWIAYDTPVDDEDRADMGYVIERAERLFPHLRNGVPEEPPPRVSPARATPVESGDTTGLGIVGARRPHSTVTAEVLGGRCGRVLVQEGPMPSLHEIAVSGKRGFDPQILHEHEAHAVGEPPSFVRMLALMLAGPVDDFDGECVPDDCRIFKQTVDHLDAKFRGAAPSESVADFEKDAVVQVKRRARPLQPSQPCLGGLLMGVGAVGKRNTVGRIKKKCAHPPYSPAANSLGCSDRSLRPRSVAFASRDSAQPYGSDAFASTDPVSSSSRRIIFACLSAGRFFRVSMASFRFMGDVPLVIKRNAIGGRAQGIRSVVVQTYSPNTRAPRAAT